MLLVVTLNALLARSRWVPALYFCKLWWVDPGQQPSTNTVHPSMTGESIGRAKARKPIGWDKGSLIGEEKKNKWSKWNCSAPPTGRLLQTAQVVSEKPSWKPKTKLSLPLHQILLLSMPWYGMEYPCGRFISAVLAGSPPSFMPTLTEPTCCWVVGWAEWGEKRECLVVMQALFSGTEN